MDEIPQTSTGKTIMTTEPKFVPATAAKIMIVHSEDKSCMLSHQPYFSVGCRWSIVRYLMFRLGEYEYSSAGQTALYQHFLEHDSFVVPDAPVLSERPQLPQPIFVE